MGYRVKPSKLAYPTTWGRVVSREGGDLTPFTREIGGKLPFVHLSQFYGECVVRYLFYQNGVTTK